MPPFSPRRAAERGLFEGLRRQLGFGRTRWVVSGGGSLTPQVDDFYEARGREEEAPRLVKGRRTAFGAVQPLAVPPATCPCPLFQSATLADELLLCAAC